MENTISGLNDRGVILHDRQLSHQIRRKRDDGGGSVDAGVQGAGRNLFGRHNGGDPPKLVLLSPAHQLDGLPLRFRSFDLLLRDVPDALHGDLAGVDPGVHQHVGEHADLGSRIPAVSNGSLLPSPGSSFRQSV